MRAILPVLAVSWLLLASAPPPAAAKRAAKGIAVTEKEELPEINWELTGTGFVETFKARNIEVESAEPNRFFPGAVAFALGRIDEGGHFLMLNCGSSMTCGTKRDELEDRMIFTCLLDSVRTPKVRKSALYDGRTWELTSIGDRYIKILMKRYPDLPKRLGRLVAGSLPRK